MFKRLGGVSSGRVNRTAGTEVRGRLVALREVNQPCEGEVMPTTSRRDYRTGSKGAQC